MSNPSERDSNRWRITAAPPKAQTMCQHQRSIQRPASHALQTSLEFSGTDERFVDGVVIVVLRDLLRPDDVLDAATNDVRRVRLSEVPPAVRELIAQDHSRPLSAGDPWLGTG